MGFTEVRIQRARWKFVFLADWLTDLTSYQPGGWDGVHQPENCNHVKYVGRIVYVLTLLYLFGKEKQQMLCLINISLCLYSPWQEYWSAKCHWHDGQCWTTPTKKYNILQNINIHKKLFVQGCITNKQKYYCEQLGRFSNRVPSTLSDPVPRRPSA